MFFLTIFKKNLKTQQWFLIQELYKSKRKLAHSYSLQTPGKEEANLLIVMVAISKEDC